MPPKPPPPKPPRRRRKAARPGELIEAGLAEFAAHGFAKTRLEDVAARAGVSKATIYRYFENKDELFRAAVRSEISLRFDGMNDMIDAYRGDTATLLTAIIAQTHERFFAADVRVFMRILVAEGREFPELVEFYYTQGVSKGVALMRRILQRGVDRGEFSPHSAIHGLPMLMMAPAVLAAIWRMTFETHFPLPAEPLLRGHLEMVLGALRPPAPSEQTKRPSR